MSIELNAHNAKSIAKQLMKAKDMHVKRNFTPVNSSYTLSTLSDRYIVNLSDNQFSSLHEIQKNNEWVPVALNQFKGPLELVQSKCMQYLELLFKNRYN